MSAAAPTEKPREKPADKSAPPPPKTVGGYDVARPHGQCVVCGKGIEPDAKFMATLRETPAAFERLDCCLDCWDQFQANALRPPAPEAPPPASLVGFWKTTMPRPEARKKLFVDDEVLCTLFERLADAREESKIQFRFMLGLILMRKRLVVYEGCRKDGEQDVWIVRLRGRDAKLDLLDPHLNEEQIQGVSQQLGEILHEEL